MAQCLEHVVASRARARSPRTARATWRRGRRAASTTSQSSMPSPVATAIAAALSKPPSKTAEPVEHVPAALVERASTTSRPSPAASGGARPRVRRPPVSSRNRSSSRSAISRGVIDTTRAGRELDGERDAVEAAADLGDRLGVPGVEDEGRLDRVRPVAEQPHRVVADQRGAVGRRGDREGPQRPHLLAVDTETLAARREHAHTWAMLDQRRGERAGGVEQVLAVVEHEEQSLGTEELCDRVGEVVACARRNARARPRRSGASSRRRSPRRARRSTRRRGSPAAPPPRPGPRAGSCRRRRRR